MNKIHILFLAHQATKNTSTWAVFEKGDNWFSRVVVSKCLERRERSQEHSALVKSTFFSFLWIKQLKHMHMGCFLAKATQLSLSVKLQVFHPYKYTHITP